MTEVKAKLNKLNISPRKTRAVARVISGLPVGEAESQLLFRKERAAVPILKLLRSAVANAKNKNISVNNLCVKEIWVNKGQVMKRWLPRARGMATPLHKKFSHISIILAEDVSKKSRFSVSERKTANKAVNKPKQKQEVKKLSSKNKEKEEKAAIKENKKDKIANKSEKSGATKTDGAIKRMFRRKSI